MFSEIGEVRLPDIIIYENDMTQFVFIFSTRIKLEESKNVK